MSANSNIEWTDHTFNPWIGCTKVSPACDHCYAERSTPARAMRIEWGPKADRRRTGADNWALPVRWNAQAEAFAAVHGRRQRVFCASLADVFDNQVPEAWRADLFELIRITPNLDWQLLTKRPQNIVRMVRESGAVADSGARYLPQHVWLGTTAEDQLRANRNIPALLRTRDELGAGVLFVSMEPLLGPVDLRVIDVNGHGEIYPLRGTTGCEDDDGDPQPDLPRIDWVIVGGESGPNARPMNPEWARRLRDQCVEAGVPFLFKQWGEWGEARIVPAGTPGRYALASRRIDGLWGSKPTEVDAYPRQFTAFGSTILERLGKKRAGRLLAGRTWDEMPERSAR